MFVAASSLTSCHKRQEIEQADRAPIQDVIDQTTKDTVPWFHYMSATFSCEVSGISASGLARVSQDSLIWLSVSKLVEVGRAILTPDSVLVYAKINNSYYRCDYAYIKSRFGIDIDYARAQRLLVENASNTGSTVTVPIHAAGINTEAKIRFTKVDYPTSLAFPFSIPARAKRMTMSMFD